MTGSLIQDARAVHGVARELAFLRDGDVRQELVDAERAAGHATVMHALSEFRRSVVVADLPVVTADVARMAEVLAHAAGGSPTGRGT